MSDKASIRAISGRNSFPALLLQACLALLTVAFLFPSPAKAQGTFVAGQETETQLRSRAAAERVIRNRTSTIASRKVAELLGAVQTAKLDPVDEAEVLRVAQRMLDQEVDSFGDESASVRLSVESALRKANDEVRRKYDGLFSGPASAALTEALADPNPEKLRQICRQYFLTSAGYTAAERMVAHWLDAGEFGLAKRLADQIMAEPWHRQRMTPQFRTLVASLNSILADELPPVVGEPTADTTNFLRRFDRHRDTLVPLRSGWMVLGGNTARSRIVNGSAPIPVPTWTSDSIPNLAAPWIKDQLQEWEGVRKELDQPSCPAAYPIIVDGQVIFRGFDGVRSIDAKRGTINWTYRCRFNPLQSTSRSENVIRRTVAPASAIPGANGLGENSLMGALASDGQRVYLIDSMTSADESEPVDPSTEGFQLRFRNRLVALHVRASDPAKRVAWIQTGRLPERFQKQGGSTEFRFLGPPLPGPAELLCLTERDLEIHLTAFEPQSGEMVWSQPLCTLERSEEFDLDRHETASLLARADGIVVCPTNTGLLVAVDQARSTLLWAAFVDELPNARQIRSTTYRAPTIGYAGYLPHVMISRGRVVYLSPHSRQLHCLDLTTGRFLWSVSRSDAEFVGAMTDRQALIVGRMGCRSLSLDNGREVWVTTTPTPAGRGIAIGNRYVLPLEDGHLASLDMATGHDLGTKSLYADVPLGHLVADRDRVYSLSQRGLVAFSQVDHVLSTINAGLPDERNSANRRIMQAEVAMVQGNLRDADRKLREVLSEELSLVDRERARRDLKELLFERMSSGSALMTADYAVLDQLLVTPQEQLRFMVAASAQDPRSLDKRMIKQLAERAYELPQQLTALASSDKGEWTISPAVWCRLRLEESADAGFSGQIRQLGLLRRPRLQGKESIEEIERYVRVFDSEQPVNSVRSFLSVKFAAAGSVHSAETLLLRNRSDLRPDVAAEATLRLAELWEKSGMITDAVRQLDQLATQFADVRLSDGQTGASHVRKMSSERPAVKAWRQSREPTWPIDHVEVHQTIIQPDFKEQLLPPANGSTENSRFQWDRLDPSAQGRRSAPYGQSVEFVVSQPGSDDQLLTVIDQRNRQRLGSLKIPVPSRVATSDKLASGGHLVPFGVQGGIIGVSTLELGDETPVWTLFPADLTGRRTPVIPGPSGAEFASFIWKNRMYVVDPLDGALLWERRIPIDSESPYNLDIVGDREVLAIYRDDRTVDPPRRMYEVFDTATGRKIRTVRPGFIPGIWQGAHGRFVVGFVDTPDGRRLQIRDLQNDFVEMSESVADPNRQPMLLPGGQLLFLGLRGEVKVFDLSRRQKVLSAQLAESELVPIGNYKSFMDHERYFVNLQRHTPTAMTTHTNQAVTNSPVPGIHLRDDLYAFDRNTGELLWKRSIPFRTILQFPECRLPFLVSFSQVIDRVKNAVQSLTIEVIDASTGVTIGYRENLILDQLLTAHYDGETGRILIRGQSSDIELRFGPTEGQSQAGR